MLTVVDFSIRLRLLSSLTNANFLTDHFHFEEEGVFKPLLTVYHVRWSASLTLFRSIVLHALSHTSNFILSLELLNTSL